MIGVIADDFSGAAEIGGVAWRHGLRADIASAFTGSTGADVLVVNTGSRSLPAAEIPWRIAGAARFLESLAPEWLFVKVDSVLRGHVGAQIAGLATVFSGSGYLVVPGNPSLGRRVVSGRILIDGVPLHQTFFARDPQHPARSAEVLELLGPEAPDAAVGRVGSPLPAAAVIAGDVIDEEDLARWARIAFESRRVPVGAAPFFAALLEARGQHPASRPALPLKPGKALLVNGSASEPAQAALRAIEDAGVPVTRMPDDVFAEGRDEGIRRWADEIAGMLASHHRAVAAAGRPLDPRPGRSARIEQALAAVTRAVCQTAAPDHLFLEGGATAFAVIQAVGSPLMRVRHEWAPGAASLESTTDSGPLVTVKVGSYTWPQPVWQFLVQGQSISRRG